MATALTVYMSGTAATTVATADTLLTAAPASSTSHTTKIGTSINWGEVFSQGSTATWPASASEPSPGAHGFLLDATTLELRQLSAGTYTPSVSLKASVGSIVADIHVRLYKRSSAGVFTLIADCVKAAATINTTQTTYNSGWTGNTGSALSFVAGDKLYLDVILKITTNSSGSSTATLSLFQNAGAIEASTTPGYVCNMAGVSTVTASNPNAALKVVRTMSGVISGTASNPNTVLTILRRMQGVISVSASNPSAVLKIIRHMAGIISGSASSPNTSLGVTRKFSGVISTSASLTAPLKVTRTFQGTIATSASLTGKLTAIRRFAGVISTSSSLQGTLGVIRQLSGAISSSATLIGILTVKRMMSGVITTSVSNSGTLTAVRTFAGTISTSVTTSGTLQVIRNFTSVITTTAVLLGDLTVIGGSTIISLAGRISTSASLSGSLTVIRNMQGTITTSATIRPAVVGVIRAFAGVINVVGNLLNIHFSVLVKHSITGTYKHVHKIKCVYRHYKPLTVVVNRPIHIEGLYKRIHP